MNIAHSRTRGPRRRAVSLVLLSAALVSIGFMSGCGGGGSAGDEPARPDAPTASFLPLGAPAGHVTSEATAISADGLAVAGTAKDATGREQAFRWTVGAGFTALGFLPGGTRSTGADMSSDGSVVVGSADTSAMPTSSLTAFRWTATGGMQRVAPLPSTVLCNGTAVSGDGQVVVGTCLGTNNTAFRWTEATGPVSLGQFGGGLSAASTASAISSDGQVIGGAGSPVLRGAMLWPFGQPPVTLGHLATGDTFASVSALSADGGVAAGVSIGSTGAARMFRWTVASGVTAITGAPSDVTAMNVRALSASGAVLVGGWTRGGVESAVIWDQARGLRTLAQALTDERRLTLSGWTLQRANAISPDGRAIAGTGINPQGVAEGWIVRLN
ncbi:PEP-CTERM sorting domain-containing protein [Caenimonas sp. SL110]|uniref:PEP-CTERM sorting domain-containing protein n=1 Tax=Caenimonas sp. SL110 TaxID=1450524 RepID=UPI00128C4F82|nr:PEP-CTERM sorting domain-containing protein [Caenimonas sp. SL110]